MQPLPATRARPYFGVDVGVLMVNSRFRRFPGDIGNAKTWSYPVQYKVVREAQTIAMTNLHEVSLLEEFKAAGRELAAEGIPALTTSCGFLVLYQQELADHCKVPVATSSLLQVPLVQRLLPSGQRVGILTYSAESLRGPYLEAAGIPADTPVAGMPAASEFVRSIREGDCNVPRSVLNEEVAATAQRLIHEHPEVGAIVLECTNLSPYSARIRELTGRPVFDVTTLVDWLQAGMNRPQRAED